jgi:hypothetical protein
MALLHGEMSRHSCPTMCCHNFIFQFLSLKAILFSLAASFCHPSVVCGQSSLAPSANKKQALVPTFGEAVYEGFEGAYNFEVPDPELPINGSLSSNVTFKFRVKPKGGVFLKVLPEKSRLLLVQSNEGAEWRMQPVMMKTATFSTSESRADGIVVSVKMPLKVGKGSSLTIVQGTIAAEVLGGEKTISTGVVEPVKGMLLKLEGDAVEVEAPVVYEDGRHDLVVKLDWASSVWSKSRYKVADSKASAAEMKGKFSMDSQMTFPFPGKVKGEFSMDARMIFPFPGKVPRGEFVVDVRERIGVADIPFVAILPNRNLLGLLAGMPVEKIPEVGTPLKPGQVPMPVASTDANAVPPAEAGADATPLVSEWQSGETLRFSVENIVDTRMPGDLGLDLHVRLRNDVKIEVLEMLPKGDVRLGMTFERVRVEETDEGKYRMADTLDDTPDKLASNPWSKIVGKRLEMIYTAEDGKVTLVEEDALVRRLAGKDFAAALVVRKLLNPSDLTGLVEIMKPRFSKQSRAKAGSAWNDEMNPRIPLSDITLAGEERVVSANGPYVVLNSTYSLPENTPPKKLLGQQLEFKMVSAKYKQIDVARNLHWDSKQKTCAHLSQHLLMLLEGKLDGQPLKIESTQKSHCWLLERTVKQP